MIILISFEDGEKNFDWIGFSDVLVVGYVLFKVEILDSFLYWGKDMFLVCQVWIDGLGVVVKVVMVFLDNLIVDMLMIYGLVSLFDDVYGDLVVIVDFYLVMKWKMVGDSLLGVC